MPLWVIIVAPTGVAAIVLITWWLGGFYRDPIRAEWLVRFFGDEEPPLTVTEHVIGSDGKSALVLLDGETLGVVTRVGDGLAWRPILPPATVRSVVGGVRIRLRLPTFPTVHFEAPDGGFPASIERAMKPFLEE